MYGTAFNYAINFLSVCDMYVWSHKVISQVFLQYVQPCYYVASLLSTKLVMLDVAIHTKYVMVNRTQLMLNMYVYLCYHSNWLKIRIAV